MSSVLIIEDEKKVARFIQRGLTAEGFQADIAPTGDEGLRMVKEHAYDLLTVDLMIPGVDGFSLIKRLRQDGCTSPVLILSARDALRDKLYGFDVGADDYLQKPFAFEELVARLRALMRRKETLRADLKLKYHDLEMDTESRTVSRAGHKIELTLKEYNLLEFFLRNPEKVLTRAKIGEQVWKEQFERETNVVEVYIMYLRKKVDTGYAETLLQTIRGVGYQLVAAPASQSEPKPNLDQA